MTTTPLADLAVTPAMLLEQVSEARATADAADVEVLRLAVEWAHAHPALPGDEAWVVRARSDWQPGEYDASVADAEDFEDEVAWCGIPPVRWDAPAAFAAANSMTTTGGKALLRDALVLRHRLPHTWARVEAGRVPAWRARRIAQAVLGAPADVVAEVDLTVAPIAESIGPIVLDRRIEEALQRLHAEERELAQQRALAARFVRVDDLAAETTGVSTMEIRGDWKDVHDFDDVVSAVAAALGAAGCEEPLDVRRAMAVGVLADPEQAAALLAGSDAPAPRRQTVLYLHLSDLAVLGLDPVGSNETTRRAVLEQQIRAWCGRTDTHLTIKPVLDLATTGSTDAYAIPELMRERTMLRLPDCVFPWCTRPARRCDLDHICSFACRGTTTDHNLAPLCRHHHRLKTFTGWTYRPLDPHPVLPPTAFVWTDPHGIEYLRRPTGTQPIRSVDPAAHLRTGTSAPAVTAVARQTSDQGVGARPSSRSVCVESSR